MGEDTCLDITLAGALFVSTNVATTPAGLHASPTAVRDTRWSGATIAVAAAETARGMRAEKEIPLGAENHLVVLADPGGISIQVYDHAPASV
jgi:hypothetical protein